MPWTLFTAAACVGTLFAAPVEKDPLVKVADYHMKNARQGAAAAALGDFVYVFGGNARGAVTAVERFNVGTHQFEELKTPLLPRRYHSVIEHEGKFYLFGGQGYALPNQVHEYAVEIYDPVTNTVERGVPMPTPREHMAAAKIGSRAYFIGGTKLKSGRRAQTNDVDIFDFSSGKWSTGVPMPTPREASAAVVDQFIIVPGGYRAGSKVDVVEFFVPAENSWKQLPKLGRATSAHSLAFLGKYLFLFGDYEEPGSILAYDLGTRKTAQSHAAFIGARHTTAVVHRDLIYIIGGNNSSASGDESDLIQVFRLQ